MEFKIIDAASENLSTTDVVRCIQEYSPDIIGLTAMSFAFKTAIHIAKDIKEVLKDSIIVFGGVHASVMPDEVLSYDFVDYVVRHEGEYTFLELIQRIREEKSPEGVRGVSFKKDGLIVHNPPRERILDFDTLPFPDRTLLNMNLYKATSWFPPYIRRRAIVLGGRGCPNQCTFCASSTVWGNRQCVMRSATSILNEIEEIINRFHIRGIHFGDEIITLRKTRLIELCEGILDKGLNISWTCFSTVNTLDREAVTIMKKSGCCMILMGVESGSEKVRKNIKKRISQQEILDAFRITKEVGIRRTACFLLGSLGETAETFQETIDLAKEIRADDYALNVITPYPGTELYEKFVGNDKNVDWEKNYTTDPEIPDDAYVFYPCCELSQEEMSKLWRKFRREVEFSINWSNIKMNTNRILFPKSFRRFKRNVKAALKMILIRR